MKSFLRALGIAAAVVIFPAAFSGCDSPDEGGVVLRLTNWGGAGEDNDYDRLVKDLYRRFERDHPGVRLKIENIPGEYVPKMLLNFVAGTQPEVMVLDASSAAVFVNNGLLTDLRPFVESDPEFDLSDFYPNVVDIARRGDKLYAIPIDFTPMVVYYNKDLFDKAGVPYPDPNWTFAEFFEIAQKLTIPAKDPGLPPVQYGFVFTNWMPAWVMWLWNNGGDVLSPDGSKATGYLDSDPNVETLTFLRDLVKRHKVAPSLSEMQAMGADPFVHGKAAMVVMGHWALTGYKNAPKDSSGKPLIDWERLGVAHLPHNTPEPNTVFYEAGLAIPKDCKHPEEAWKFIRYWTSAEVQRVYNSSGIAVSARKDISRERAADPIEAQFLPIVPSARPPYGSQVESYEIVENVGRSMIDSILNNDVPVREALRRAASRIDREFAKR